MRYRITDAVRLYGEVINVAGFMTNCVALLVLPAAIKFLNDFCRKSAFSPELACYIIHLDVGYFWSCMHSNLSQLRCN
jgi:hypothetical protein